jgi:hypothetical protein
MKKNILLSTLALLAMVLPSACSKDSSEDEQPPVKVNPLLGKWGLYCIDYKNDTIPNEYFDIPEDTILFYEDGRYYNSIEKRHYDYTYTDSTFTLSFGGFEELHSYTISDMGKTLKVHYEGGNTYDFWQGPYKIPYYYIYKKIAEIK